MDSESVTESSEWVLKFQHGDDQILWVADVPLWEATTMLVGIFHILGLTPDDVSAFVKANYESRVSVWWKETTYYEGTLGDLAGIALQELADSQQEKASTPAQGRGSR